MKRTNGSGTFSEDALVTDLLNATLTTSFLEDRGGFLLGDIDGDGATELVLSEDSAGCTSGGSPHCASVYSVIGTGSARYTLQSRTSVRLEARHLRQSELVDVNGDGLPDLVIPPYSSQHASLDDLDSDEGFDDVYGSEEPHTLWIPNSGAVPYLDALEIRSLSLPVEDPSSSAYGEIVDLAVDCLGRYADADTYTEPYYLAK